MNMLGHLKNHEIDMLLASQAVGRIACSANGKPYIFPVTYAFDGEHIFCQTNNGTKLDLLRLHPEVCFEVDTMIDVFNWKSVVVRGHCEELTGTKEERARDFLNRRILPLLTPSMVHPNQHAERIDLDDTTRIKEHIICITIDESSGRYQQL